MTSGSFIRTAAAAGGAAVLALLIAAPSATAAPTGSSDVQTPGWTWFDVANDGQTIGDVTSSYSDFNGTGLALHGWADDAFDDYLANSGQFSYPGYADIAVDFSPVSEDYVDNGLTTIVASEDLDFGDGITFTATSTMEIQGSYSRWTVSFENTGAGDSAQLTYSFEGNLGSDSATVWVPDGAGQYVSYQDPAAGYGLDPILGWKITSADTAALSAVDGNDNAYVTGSGDFVVTVGLVDWDVCSFDAALAGMSAAVPTFDTTFGGSLPNYYTTNCWALAQPAAAIAGAAVDYTIPLTSLPAQYGTMSNSPDSDYLDGVEVHVVSAPPGFTVTVERDASDNPYLHVVGTMPAAAATITLVLATSDGEGPALEPFVSTLSLTPTVTAALAATGGSPATPWMVLGAGTLVLIGAGVLAARRRV